jgi:hypothetical protein
VTVIGQPYSLYILISAAGADTTPGQWAKNRPTDPLGDEEKIHLALRRPPIRSNRWCHCFDRRTLTAVSPTDCLCRQCCGCDRHRQMRSPSGLPLARGVLLHLQIVISPFVWGSKQAATYHPQVACHWSRDGRSLPGKTHAAYSTETSESAERLDEPCIRTMLYRSNLQNKRGAGRLPLRPTRT